MYRKPFVNTEKKKMVNKETKYKKKRNIGNKKDILSTFTVF